MSSSVPGWTPTSTSHARTTPGKRGLNEHANGLVRQYFGKGESLLDADPGQVRRVADLLNDRPRKALGYRSPREMFQRAALAAANP